jgi:hypothetical protein
MPLLDHFAPSVDERISWTAFHANWATRLAEYITELLPDGFTAEETSYPSCEVAIDVATYEDAGRAADSLRSDWQPPPPAGVTWPRWRDYTGRHRAVVRVRVPFSEGRTCAGCRWRRWGWRSPP